ncbi:MAG: DNA primase [Gaiellaceae bacterium]
MARLKDTSVEAVRQAADIVAVVSARTQLRKSGARHTGRCPFHEERTPSFSVSADKGTYYCFGCGKGGDTIGFVKETENLDFIGAIEWLAERFNVPLEYEESSPEQEAERRRRDRQHELLESATAFYERHLWESEAGGPVREYLASRGLGEEVSREFRLGLSPGGTTIAAKAHERSFANDELKRAGLVNARGNDYFGQRLMFPLMDGRGRVVGFSARKLHEDDPLRGKYVNSPESELFHKSSVLYGFHLARPAIAKQDRALVVEGNTDAIALRQAGLEPVVASLGTALTERQLKELGRLTHRLFLCFDADAAGQAATMRGMELAVAQGFEVKVVTLPPGLDPADDPSGFEARLSSAESFLGYRVRLAVERAPSRQEAFVRARELLDQVEESPERQEAMSWVAGRLDLPKETQAGLAGQRLRGTGAASARLVDAGERLERDALAGVIAYETLVPMLEPDYFDTPVFRRVCERLLSGGEPDPELVPVLAELDARAGAYGIDARVAEELLLRLRERRLEREFANATPDRVLELQAALARVRSVLRG